MICVKQLKEFIRMANVRASTDDGIGISPEKQLRMRLNQELNILPAESGGYGMVNVAERLRNYYGEESCLEFDSILGKGTTVKILLPICKCMNRTGDEY